MSQSVSQERSAVLVVNTHSRKGARSFLAAVEELTRKGISLVNSYPVRHPEHLPKVIQKAIKGGNKLIIVGGGDGTITSVVDSLAKQDVVLGILPLGTANSFARTLGIPMDLTGAIDVIVHGKAAKVDLGQTGGDYFANAVTIGVAAQIAQNIPPKLKKFTGFFAYGLMGICFLFSHRPFQCTLTMNEEVFMADTHQIVIANGSFFGTLPLISGASAQEQALTVYIMDTTSRLGILKLWISLLLRKPMAFPQARFFRTREVLLEANPPQSVEVDGEIMTRTPVLISLTPKALQVMVPCEPRNKQ